MLAPSCACLHGGSARAFLRVELLPVNLDLLADSIFAARVTASQEDVSPEVCRVLGKAVEAEEFFSLSLSALTCERVQ